MFFKKYSLHDEDEYRVAFLLNKNLEKGIVKYREKGSSRIPCIEYHFDADTLKSITLAPGNDDFMQLKDIIRILDQRSYNNVELLKAIEMQQTTL